MHFIVSLEVLAAVSRITAVFWDVMWMLIFYQPTATTVQVRVFYPQDSNLGISLLLYLMLVDVVSIEQRTLYGCMLTTFC